MLQRDIVDKLYVKALRRYKKEHPEFKITDKFADRIWYCIKGKLEHDGETAAKKYVEEAELLI